MGVLIMIISFSLNPLHLSIESLSSVFKVTLIVWFVWTGNNHKLKEPLPGHVVVTRKNQNKWMTFLTEAARTAPPGEGNEHEPRRADPVPVSPASQYILEACLHCWFTLFQ